jgi:hypothetical protein
MLKMPYIHYIDVKSNEHFQQDITGLSCLIMICSLVSGLVPVLPIYYIDVEHNEHDDEMASVIVIE